MTGAMLAGFLTLLGVAGYYAWAWVRLRYRQPKPGTVVPIFSPPDGLSAPAMRYLLMRKCDDRTLAAAVIDLAVRGHLELSRQDRDFAAGSVLTIRRRFCNAPLPLEEQALLEGLATKGQRVTIEPENFALICDAKDFFEETLEQSYKGGWFTPSTRWAWAGTALFVGSLWLVAAVILASSGWWGSRLVLIALSTTAATALLATHSPARSRSAITARSVGLFVLGTVTCSYLFLVIPAVISTGIWQPLVLPLLALPLVISGFRWMATPTPKGRQALDHLAGFHDFILRTDFDRLQEITGAASRAGKLDSILPYAIALGVENRWADDFIAELKHASSILGIYSLPSIGDIRSTMKAMWN